MQASDLSSSLILPEWPAPASIVAAVTTRPGGCSGAPFNALNLAHHVDDDPAAVAENRHRLQSWLGPDFRAVQWLNQVHGTRVAGLQVDGTPGGIATDTADALVIDRPGFVGAVLTADCLPVLFTSTDGRKAAVAHAGWRGLLDGILERTLEAMAIPGSAIVAWLGPAIGPCHFEVGEEVRTAFINAAAGSGQRTATAAAFQAGKPGKYHADLYALARQRLSIRGVDAVYGGGLCTFCDSARFFSYRRDGRCGRMASVIGILPQS